MNKGYMVVNIPEKCGQCFCARRYSDSLLGPDGVVYRTFYFCAARFSDARDIYEDECSVDITGDKPEWCPILPQPERYGRLEMWDEYEEGVESGRNNLIDEIFGGEDADTKTTENMR